jgi:DNA-directed RNA polymerase specialized sigma24 family protein
MSVAERVAEHLPYLRRFARATTGSQKSGDAYVVLTLEAILEDPSIISEELPARVGLYRVFAKVLNSIEWTGEKNGEAPQPVLEAARRNLQMLAPRARQAFLLIAVEDFSPGEAALVLDVDEG